MTEIAVFRSLWGEVEDALLDGWTEQDIFALALWTGHGGRFMTRLRESTKPPRKYYKTRYDYETLRVKAREMLHGHNQAND